jgi:predicted transcriptional regulator
MNEQIDKTNIPNEEHLEALMHEMVKKGLVEMYYNKDNELCFKITEKGLNAVE